MKISLKHQTTEHSNATSCKVTEHHLNDPMLDCAIAKISGRYPEARRVVNLGCNELVYVFQGEGKVVVNHTEYKLAAGDAVVIEAGEKYYWEGNMQLFISCRPAWNKEQHQLVD
ncbi:Cupin domain [Legionella steigerwaltii]|uniref:Cupin domain n=1 Tax=Legionella steigerwaltii TaxID=460 RepID=A0A378LCM3_9GAMM|nr:cupin domain-containing protein [Legionella steigerwaltii]KTD72102.1 Cupin domain protein [Legionella steigerwaltii]STY21861.1 Cupin domain [Legionella steigerwaltii]